MPGSYAFDTNIAVAILNDDPAATEQWENVETALLPAPVVGELLYGAHKSHRRDENIRRIANLLEETTLVPCDLPVCAEYARLKLALKELGRPIPVNDLWIAACCLATGATLVTRDNHFEGVPDLALERW